MNRVILFLCLVAGAWAFPVELCASFDCEGCYSIHVLKADTLIEKRWEIVHSVQCDCGMWLSPSFKIDDMPGETLSGTGGGCVAVGNKGGMMKMPPVPKMNLRQGDIVYTAFIADARKKVSSKFNQKLNFYWEARFVCQEDHSSDIFLTRKIDAVLVGECSRK